MIWGNIYENFPVVLKCLHNSQDITADFLGEIESHTIASYNHSYIVRCYGITKDPMSNDFIMVMFYAEMQAEEADKINEKFTSTSLPYNGTTLSYTTNPQAVYTSRLLDFKNLPEPKNVIDNNDNNNLFEEYSSNN
ncbi:uncharacterized protein OCT59_015206 [Rhizophagus irregularis]|uniref:uncharacterized protein n=1 Tax=Rhizophagus irregularis TaxID=588596 RepID=UPI00331BE2C6|nr:hypothetical protein OCT59_015206 [Rhizophagus irregularis]